MKILLFLVAISALFSLQEKKEYTFFNDPIDVVIPSTYKDVQTLDLCIEGVRKNVKNLGRIIVVSPTKLTNKAEWFDEKRYPFTQYDLGLHIYNQNTTLATWFATKARLRGWIYQQFLKLYASFVIPNISSNVLVVDSDVIFFRPVEFLGTGNAGLYAPATEHLDSYFIHINKLVPGLTKQHPELSGISHHMLFQRSILKDLFAQIESEHNTPAWQAICHCMNPVTAAWEYGMSEYELYFNFALASSDQVKVRELKWENSGDLSEESRNKYLNSDIDYVAFHTYLRK